MGSDYNAFLATEVLSDEKLVTYRLVARAMGVHANEAKKMLYEFHRRENAKRAGSVHANYLLSGIKKRPVPTGQASGKTATPDGEDVEMRSSPFPGSSMPQGAAAETDETMRCLTLVQEERLEEAKSQFLKLTGIHVYSVQPSSLKNMETVSDVNERLFREYSGQDPLTHGKTYGVICNSRAKRRSGARPPPPPEPTPAPSSAKPSKSSQPESKKEPPSSSATPSSSKPPLLKKVSSSLFKSFAKSKPLSKSKASPTNDEEDVKVKPGGPVTDSSARGAHSMAVSSLGKETDVQQDVHMTSDGDDDDDDEEPVVAPKGTASGRKSKAERDAELARQIFDDDDEDEDMPDAAAEEKQESAGREAETAAEEEADEPEEDGQEVEEKKTVKEEEEPTEHVTVVNGRRRGKRRVMRKRMIKDAEGYLVSREEPGWESFSEEDVPPPKPKSKPSVSSTGKKGQPAKKGQGNIMSFFGKK